MAETRKQRGFVDPLGVEGGSLAPEGGTGKRVVASRLSRTESRSSEALDQCRQAIVVVNMLFINGLIFVVSE
jgi:hypothetical protein